MQNSYVANPSDGPMFREENIDGVDRQEIAMRQDPMKVGFGALVTTWCVLAAAADLSQVAGHYRYDAYNVKLPNGRQLSLNDLGATEAFLDISASGTITLRMRMRTGKTVTQTAHVIDANFSGPNGFWIAQWPDMTYPVRAEIRLAADTLISDTHFTDRSDTARFGSVEHAVLRRQSP